MKKNRTIDKLRNAEKTIEVQRINIEVLKQECQRAHCNGGGALAFHADRVRYEKAIEQLNRSMDVVLLALCKKYGTKVGDEMEMKFEAVPMELLDTWTLLTRREDDMIFLRASERRPH